MPETYENWLSLVKNCIYYAHEVYEIYQVLSYSVDFKAPSVTSEMTLKLKSNLYVKPVNVWNVNVWKICV